MGTCSSKIDKNNHRECGSFRLGIDHSSNRFLSLWKRITRTDMVELGCRREIYGAYVASVLHILRNESEMYQDIIGVLIKLIRAARLKVKHLKLVDWEAFESDLSEGGNPIFGYPAYDDAVGELGKISEFRFFNKKNLSYFTYVVICDHFTPDFHNPRGEIKDDDLLFLRKIGKEKKPQKKV